jgi:hypothetical protein
MSGKSHARIADLRGASRLAIDATVGLTSLVETMHHNILRTPGVLGAKTQAPTNGITGLVYKSIRGATRLVGGGIDAVLRRFAARFDDDARSSPQRETVLAVLNGVLGDHLEATSNPLATAMQWRREGRPLQLTRAALQAAMPAAHGKLLLLVHGLCMNDLRWQRNGHDHGAALAVDAGFTPLCLNYNSGLHVSTNGRALARQIESLRQAWPVPLSDVSILAHSMGGLLARSACHYGKAEGHGWLSRLSRIVFLGTPQHGAPLERGGNWIDAVLDASPYTTAFARLGKIRSAGITDLRHGSVLDEDWNRGDRFERSKRKPPVVPLPAGVACYALAASISDKSIPAARRLIGDGLVPVDSALGRHRNPQRDLHVPDDRRWVAHGLHHLDLLDDRAVYERIRLWLGQ